MVIARLALPIVVLALAMNGASQADPVHGIALHGTPRQASDFQHFSYVDPEAPKGGRVRLSTYGSFDSLNPLIIKGVSANGIREYVYESLMARGLDEPFTLYGLIAESVEMPDDRSWITFNLNPKARFSDGHPVTADDVLFSLDLLKTKGRPNHRTYYSKVANAEKLSDHKVRLTFDAAGDREIPLILGLLPILPSHLIDPETFESTTLDAPVGTGPYRVANVDPGRSIIYERDPNYWGKDLPVNRGRFNFDEVRFDYFRESSVMFEAFKTGNIDVWPEYDPRRWANAYSFPAVKDGRVVKQAFDIGLPAGMTALVFNTRRRVFSDPRVRQALILLFNFEWINRTLFAGLYHRTQSYFERSVLSSAGRPADARERELLAPFSKYVKPKILDGTYRFPSTGGTGHNRKNQRAAFRLLKEAGYTLKDGKLVNPADGRQLTFEILAESTAQEGLLLSFARDVEQLGIKVSVRIVDGAQYQERLTNYDYDMIVNTWPSSLSPGNEQLFRWSSKAADTPGTYNFAGVKNPAADAMIQAMLEAETEDGFVSAVRALDRVLLSGDYVIPLFHIPKQWLAYWTQLKHPAKTPLFGYNLDSWWSAGG